MRLLSWLEETPENFGDRCKSLAGNGNVLAATMALANSDLSVNQAHRLYGTIVKTAEIQAVLKSKLDKFKLGVVSNGTLDLLTPMLAVAALRRGIFLEIVSSDFDQAMQEAINPASRINRSTPDAVLLALDFRAFPFGANAWAASPEGGAAASGLEMLQQIRRGFRKNSGAVCLVQNLATPPHTLLGSLDSQITGTLRKELADFNRELARLISADSDILLDVASLVGEVGSRSWFDERQWLTARIPLANQFIPLYCEHIARLIASLRGKSKKCLVLDLDNTLWGGVIGDDGIDGIVVGPGSPFGEAHLALQRYALELKSLGVLLAVCSKNDEKIARDAFRKHPDMLLREQDFAVFIADWEDKASNIRRIAQRLNIGLDSLVFVDDNPAERAIVRALVPEVAVPEIPADPSLVPRTVAAAGYFEMTYHNSEDSLRSEQYIANTKRLDAMEASGGVDEFLQSLEMKIAFSPFDTLGRKRITQLINKTNQFNLTTRRYSETEIEAFERSDDFFTLQVRLVDRFGDNGMISVVICRKLDSVWEIDTWLMSCRVIKRRAEEAVCDEIVRQARESGAKILKGIYRPTDRNAIVSGLYENLGFTRDSSDGEVESWRLDLASYRYQLPPIEAEMPQLELRAMP